MRRTALFCILQWWISSQGSFCTVLISCWWIVCFMASLERRPKSQCGRRAVAGIRLCFGKCAFVLTQSTLWSLLCVLTGSQWALLACLHQFHNSCLNHNNSICKPHCCLTCKAAPQEKRYRFFRTRYIDYDTSYAYMWHFGNCMCGLREQTLSLCSRQPRGSRPFPEVACDLLLSTLLRRWFEGGWIRILVTDSLVYFFFFFSK